MTTSGYPPPLGLSSKLVGQKTLLWWHTGTLAHQSSLAARIGAGALRRFSNQRSPWRLGMLASKSQEARSLEWKSANELLVVFKLRPQTLPDDDKAQKPKPNRKQR